MKEETIDEIRELTERVKRGYAMTSQSNGSRGAKTSQDQPMLFRVGDRVKNSSGLVATITKVGSNGPCPYSLKYERTGDEYDGFTAGELTLIARPTNQALSVSASEPQFAVGDRVITPWSDKPGTITEYRPAEYTVKLEGQGRGRGAELDYRADQLTLIPDKLSPEEAWLEVAIMVGKRESHNWVWNDKQNYNKETRHQAYVILGGNGVSVGRTGTFEHDVVKERVNGLIERAERGAVA